MINKVLEMKILTLIILEVRSWKFNCVVLSGMKLNLMYRGEAHIFKLHNADKEKRMTVH